MRLGGPRPVPGRVDGGGQPQPVLSCEQCFNSMFSPFLFAPGFELCVFAVGWRHALCCAGRPETWPGESLAHSYGLTILLHAELHPTLHECMTGVQGLARERSASNTPHMAQHVGDNPAPGTGFAAG